MPPSGNLTINQQNVANALTNFFNSTGSIPVAFAMLSAAGLTIASGELGTGVIQSSIKADDLFLNLLLDPTIAGRAGGFATPGGAPSQFADGRWCLRLRRQAHRDIAASARPMRWRPRRRHGRRSRSAAGASGPRAMAARNRSAAMPRWARRTPMPASGAWRRARTTSVSPDSLLGFALAGGGTGFSLANGLGSGSADLFQAGAYGRNDVGPSLSVGGAGLWLA